MNTDDHATHSWPLEPKEIKTASAMKKTAVDALYAYAQATLVTLEDQISI